MTDRKEKTYNIPKKGVQVMEEEMTAIEMQRFLNQQYAEGKTELEAYRNLMAILGLSYPQKSEKKKIRRGAQAPLNFYTIILPEPIHRIIKWQPSVFQKIIISLIIKLRSAPKLFNKIKPPTKSIPGTGIL